MRLRSAGMILLAATVPMGCMSNSRKPFATNPLVLYYKPSLSDSATILAEQATRREPAKPPMPTVARDSNSGKPTRGPNDIQQVKFESSETPTTKPGTKASTSTSTSNSIKIPEPEKLPVSPSPRNGISIPVSEPRRPSPKPTVTRRDPIPDSLPVRPEKKIPSATTSSLPVIVPVSVGDQQMTPAPIAQANEVRIEPAPVNMVPVAAGNKEVKIVPPQAPVVPAPVVPAPVRPSPVVNAAHAEVIPDPTPSTRPKVVKGPEVQPSPSRIAKAQDVQISPPPGSIPAPIVQANDVRGVPPMSPPPPPALPKSVTRPVPVLERKEAAGTFGRDPDYSWIQGVLERAAHGGCYIRFCDPAEENEHGGKVKIEDDSRLAAFPHGAVVGIRGALAQHPTVKPGNYPLYRIHQAWAVTPKP